jgi:hypothetical protein
MTMVSADWVERYCERTLGKPHGYWNPELNPVLADRIRHYLRLGLDRINALPATDSFWTGTNGEPTLYKLGDYFGPRLSSHPEDEDARWIMSALFLYNGRAQAAKSVPSWKSPALRMATRQTSWKRSSAACGSGTAARRNARRAWRCRTKSRAIEAASLIRIRMKPGTLRHREKWKIGPLAFPQPRGPSALSWDVFRVMTKELP